MQNSSGSLLVFPATVEAGIEIPEMILDRGERLILASSVLDRLEVGDAAHEVHRLPSIHQPDFEAGLAALIERFNVRRIYCSVASVFAQLDKLVGAGRLAVTLIGDSPQKRTIASHKNLAARAQRLFAFSAVCCEPFSAQDLHDFKALLLLTRQIYGETNDDKLAALFAIMTCAVPGDIVEVGALMGRSAVALGYLSHLNKVGPVLAVDPWSQVNAVQTDSPQLIQTLAQAWNLDDVFEIFLTNLHFLPRGTANYLRATSEEAAKLYGRDCVVESPELGRTQYSGAISVLHIDGNHDYQAVLQDCRLWLPALKQGGWLILDDYVWAHGDGPRRVGDALLAHCHGGVDQVFACGKALFVRFSSTDSIASWIAGS